MTPQAPTKYSLNPSTWFLGLELVLAFALLTGCGNPPEHTSAGPDRASSSSSTRTERRGPNTSRLDVEWSPKTGKGAVVHRPTSGDIFRTCFHCGFEGYTGGLVIGNFGGSGLAFYPKKKIRGHKLINLFCAQDESIWDRDENREYSYGWSENFGTGKDGARLSYVEGKVLEPGPEQVVLESTNQGGCYRVTKIAHTRAEAEWWILATKIENTCQRPVNFDLYSGDDPWLGMYKTSDGDVGWTPEGLVRHERHFGLGEFRQGGVYDLGNQNLGQHEGSFTGEANFFLMDPITPLPDRSFFANSFAHSKADISTAKPLDNNSLTALNLGWTDQTLKPGESLTIAMAVGRAVAGISGDVPKAPQIHEKDWSIWRKYLHSEEKNKTSGVLFAAEKVVVDVGKEDSLIDGTYWLHNPDETGTTLGIVYPMFTDPGHPAPDQVFIDDVSKQVLKNSGAAQSRFSIHVPGQGLAKFRVRYRQRQLNNSAVYIVTSANTWPSAIKRAELIVRHDADLGDVRISYPETFSRELNGKKVHHIVLQPFSPERELRVNWE